ncbi:MAG: hypothetical protein AAB468_01200 [Patescibacteria group bacterium]
MFEVKKSLVYGLSASLLLLGLYFAVLTLVSGWNFTWGQFADFWYFITSLAFGFGVQVGLYVYLRGLIVGRPGAAKILGVTGTTSTLSMISCCAHYLTNIVPLLGLAGALSFVAQYQLQIFWVGLAFNILGIVFIGHKIIKFKKHL